MTVVIVGHSQPDPLNLPNNAVLVVPVDPSDTFQTGGKARCHDKRR